MSISSVGTSTAAPAADVLATKPYDANQKTPTDEARARAEQPPQRAALPPGQGTRIDVLV